MRGRKACKGCGIVKACTEFSIAKRNLGGRHNFCNTCRSDEDRAKRATTKEENESSVCHAVVRLNLMRGQKFCGGCSQMKPIDQFSMRTKLDGHHQTLCRKSECTDCSAKRSKEWYHDNTDRALAYNPINILRQKVIEKFGARCANQSCLVPGGCTDVRALQVDHVNNDGAEERKKLGVIVGPKGGQRPLHRHNAAKIYQMALEDTEGRYQLLCANCNIIKYRESLEKRLRDRRERRKIHAA